MTLSQANLIAMDRQLGDLIDQFAKAENWTPETDGLEHDLADQIKVEVMARLGLTKAQADALGRAL